MELTFEDFVASVKLLKPSVNKETANYYKNIQKQFENIH